MTTEIRLHRVLTVLLAAALLATLTVALTGGQRADAVDGPVDIVYVATGQNFPDALAGANLAATVGAPMLTVNTNLPLPDATVTALQALDPNQIIILGGPVAVAEPVADALEAYTRSGTVTRIEGGDRHDTAAQIADALPSKVHDADLLDGLDSTDFLRAGGMQGLRSFALPLPGGLVGGSGSPPPVFTGIQPGVELHPDHNQGVVWQTMLPVDREPDSPIEVDVVLRLAGPAGCVVVFDTGVDDFEVLGDYPLDPGSETYTLTKDTTESFERVHIVFRHPGTAIDENDSVQVAMWRAGEFGTDTCDTAHLLGARVRY